MEEIKCKDCGDYFTFTEADKRFYAEKGFSKPLRCKPCRAKKKASYDSRTDYGTRYFDMRDMR